MVTVKSIIKVIHCHGLWIYQSICGRSGKSWSLVQTARGMIDRFLGQKCLFPKASDISACQRQDIHVRWTNLIMTCNKLQFLHMHLISYIVSYAVIVAQTKGPANQVAHFRGRLLGKGCKDRANIAQSLCGITSSVESRLRWKEFLTGIWVIVFNSCRWVEPPRIWLTPFGIL